VALAVLIGVGDGFFQPASFALMKEIVPRDRLANANSAMSVSQQIGLIAGPMLGGVLVGLAGSTLAFAFDAVTFAVSGGFIARIRHRPSLPAAGAPAVDRRGVRRVLADAGVASGTYAHRWLQIALVVGPAANAVRRGAGGHRAADHGAGGRPTPARSASSTRYRRSGRSSPRCWSAGYG
jgi:MFS family permease